MRDKLVGGFENSKNCQILKKCAKMVEFGHTGWHNAKRDGSNHVTINTFDRPLLKQNQNSGCCGETVWTTLAFGLLIGYYYGPFIY